MSLHASILLLACVAFCSKTSAMHVLPWQPDDTLRVAFSSSKEWFLMNPNIARRWETTATRWDAVSWKPWRYDALEVGVQPGPRRRSAPVPLTESESFVIRLQCDSALSKEQCDKARVGFTNSARRLTSSLNIYSPIVIDAKFYSFSKLDASLSQTLGMAGATSLWGVGLNETLVSQRYGIGPLMDSRWLVPQSLMKQLVTKQMHATVQWSDSDITAYFNSDYAFWFEGDGPMMSQSIAFELVATHEMTHGLGFDSAIYPYFSSAYKPPLVTAQDFLTPDFYTRGGSDMLTGNFSTWRPLRLFDRFVYQIQNSQIQQSIAESMGIVAQYSDSRVLPEWLSTFLASDSLAKQEAKRIYKLMTAGPRTIGFKNATGWMWLQTYSTFKPGTSVAHLDTDVYTPTCDFVMTPSVQGSTGFSMQQLAANRCGQDSLGSNILSLLETLGWTTKTSIDNNVNGKVIATGTMDSGATPTGGSGGTQQPFADSDAWIKFMLGGLLGALVFTILIGGFIAVKRKRLTRGTSLVDEASFPDATPREILSSRIVKPSNNMPLPPAAQHGTLPPPSNLRQAGMAPVEVLSKSLRPSL